MTAPVYIAIDLKSFYASVECAERGLDPLTTNLVVADVSRSEKTICLAVTPPLKALGVPGRPRLFDVVQKVREINNRRKFRAPKRELTGESCDANELAENPALSVGYIVAKPRMALYVAYSTKIYGIYLRHIAPEDIHIYSIDEVFIDATSYLALYKLTAHELALKLIREVLDETGITATAGIGANLYLAKVAMDIVAKKMPADEDGVRIAELDEMSYRRQLWTHTPLTDFWRVGRGYMKKLNQYGIFTMGDVARYSVRNEAFLYKLFGVNAELLIDHAWGWEPCTIAEIKAYRPSSNSLGSGQVLHEPYTHEKARIVVWEMADNLVLDLVAKGLVTDRVELAIDYDIENLKDAEIRRSYKGKIDTDRYGRQVPKGVHGFANLGKHTSSTKQIVDATLSIYDRITEPNLLVRRVTISALHVVNEQDAAPDHETEQLDLFTDYDAQAKERDAAKEQRRKERVIQHTMLDIKRKFGKNAILKATNLTEGATAKSRNRQIGGHSE